MRRRLSWSSGRRSSASQSSDGASDTSDMPTARAATWLAKLALTPPGGESPGAPDSPGSRARRRDSDASMRVATLTRAASQRMRHLRTYLPDSAAGVWLCGTYYGPDTDQAWRAALAEHVRSLVWCTYRRDFRQIPPDGVIGADAERAAAAVGAAAEELCAPPDTAPSLVQLLTRPTEVLPSPAAIRSWVLYMLEQRGWQLPPLLYELSLAADDVPAQTRVVQSLVAVLDAVERDLVRPLRRPLAAWHSPVLECVSEAAGLPALWRLLDELHAAAASLTHDVGPTTDAGWGCMARTAQCVLANALVRIRLGRAWRRPPAHADAEYVRIVASFLDNPSSACPFSIHRIAAAGARLGTPVGEWLGPTTAAHALRTLVDAGEHGLGVALATDGMLYADDVRAAARDWRRAALVLVPQRFGLERVHPEHVAALLASFRCPQSVGIAGGRPRSSLFFVGATRDQLLYLDPHYVRAAVPFRHPPPSIEKPQDTQPNSPPSLLTCWYTHAYSPRELASFHAECAHQMPAAGIDPSMLLAFVCTSEHDLAELRAHIGAQPSPLFCIADTCRTLVPDDLIVAVDSDSE